MTTASLEQTVRECRRIRVTEFPWTAQVTYVNNASIGPIPECTRRVLDAFTARRAAPFALDDDDLAGALAEARRVAARLINADVEEVALATNTSYGLNVAARALPLEPGDVVLLSAGEFPANVYPWLLLREGGVRVDIAPTTEEGWPNEEYLLERLRDPRVRLLAVSHVQFASGYRVDLQSLGAAARQNGTYVVVDAIQALGQVPFDVRHLPVDVVACGAQKWLLSPWGSGFFYVRRELVQSLAPPFGGWMAFEGTDDFTHLAAYDTVPRPDARRFELVTLPFQDFGGMSVSVGMLLALGVDRVAEYLRWIRRPLVEAAEQGAFEIVSPIDHLHESAIVCVRTANVGESHRALARAGVVSALREGVIRISPHCYNTIEEIERVAAILAGRE